MRRLTRFPALPADDRKALRGLPCAHLPGSTLPMDRPVPMAAPPPSGELPRRPSARRILHGWRGGAHGSGDRVRGQIRPRRPTCLTQALAAELLLRRAGHPAAIHVGVAKTSSGRLAAHAWIEAYGRVLLGDHDLDHYTRLHPVGGDLVDLDPRHPGRPKETPISRWEASWVHGTSTAAPLRLSRSMKACVDLLTGVPTGAASGAMEAWRSAPCISVTPSPMGRSSPWWVPLVRSQSSMGASTTARTSSRSSVGVDDR